MFGLWELLGGGVRLCRVFESLQLCQIWSCSALFSAQNPPDVAFLTWNRPVLRSSDAMHAPVYQHRPEFDPPLSRVPALSLWQVVSRHIRRPGASGAGFNVTWSALRR